MRLLLVTGGSRGIGAAVVQRAAAAGYDIVLSYVRDAAAAEATARQARELGRRVLAVRADVASEVETMALFERVDAFAAEHGLRLVGLINNAGVVDVASRVDEMSVERLTRMFQTNVIGAFVCAREAVRRMSTRHGGAGGAIVNLSSVAAILGAPGQYVDYAASKGAIDSFTTGLARELANEGVRVNAVRPGIIDTDIHASGGQPERAHNSAAIIPMQRPGRADEVAQAVLWLLSDDASYSTGAILDVSGGR